MAKYGKAGFSEIGPSPNGAIDCREGATAASQPGGGRYQSFEWRLNWNRTQLARSSHQRWVSDVSGASGNEFLFGFSSGDEISWWRTTERGWGGCAAARGTDFSPVAGCETKVVGAEGGSTA